MPYQKETTRSEKDDEKTEYVKDVHDLNIKHIKMEHNRR